MESTALTTVSGSHHKSNIAPQSPANVCHLHYKFFDYGSLSDMWDTLTEQEYIEDIQLTCLKLYSGPRHGPRESWNQYIFGLQGLETSQVKIESMYVQDLFMLYPDRACERIQMRKDVYPRIFLVGDKWTTSPSIEEQHSGLQWYQLNRFGFRAEGQNAVFEAMMWFRLEARAKLDELHASLDFPLWHCCDCQIEKDDNETSLRKVRASDRDYWI